jgi:uncharacterized membrane protein YfcA
VENLFVGTSAAIDFAVNLSRTLIYLDGEYLSCDMWIYIPILLLASFCWSYLGKRILKRISQERFRTIVRSLILIMDISLKAEVLLPDWVSIKTS